MNVNELIERLKTVKDKTTEIMFRDSAKASYDLVAVYYGVKVDGAIGFPQVGEEPNAVILQIVPAEAAKA
jgi:hypothetical protein